MALRIAVDLDGTLADMDAALQREAERLFGPDADLRARAPIETVPDSATSAGRPKPSSAAAHASPAVPGDEDAPARTRRMPLTDSQLRELWRHVRRIDDFWTTLDEAEPGAVAQLFELASMHAWEVIFLTQRPATTGDTAQRQSQRWLDAHGFAYPSVYVMKGSRGKAADALALHAVLDDSPENCVDVKSDSRARALLIWRAERQAVPSFAARLEIDVVFSMAEALERLTRMTRPDGPRRFLARLRGAFGGS